MQTRGPRQTVAGAWRLALLAVLAGLGFFGLQRWRADRALANHLQSGERYAARQLELMGTLPPVLDESSGLAVSRTQPGVFWSHNDSGDAPNLYAIDPSGRLLATFEVAGAEARDWEDMALGRCLSETPRACLYLADIGDNTGVREWLTVYVVEEPTVPPPSGTALTIPSRAFRYRLPNGPDDAEAIAVLPDGDVTIVSKGRSGAIVFYRLGREAVARAAGSGETLIAEYVGDTGIPPDGEIGRLVTGAAMSPDASVLAVRTYYDIYFYSAVNGSETVRWRSLDQRCFLGDAEPQGEAIDYLDRDTLVITSERSSGASGLMHRVRC